MMLLMLPLLLLPLMLPLSLPVLPAGEGGADGVRRRQLWYVLRQQPRRASRGVVYRYLEPPGGV